MKILMLKDAIQSAQKRKVEFKVIIQSICYLWNVSGELAEIIFEARKN